MAANRRSLQDRIAEKEKRLEQTKNELIALRQRESKESRAARTRELIQLGGLVKIAEEISGQQLDPETVLGVLLYGFSSSAKPDKAEMIASFRDRGSKTLAERSQKK